MAVNTKETYQYRYDKIIQKAQSENRKRCKGIYYENHHIIPKCMNGSDEEYNRVLLTAKEHYVCHKLLTYIYPENRKLVNAFWRMTFDKKGKHNISARDYAYARELKSLTPVSEETKTKQSINNAHYWKNKKRPKESIEKMIKTNTGKHHTEETKAKQRKHHRNHTKEEKEKMKNKWKVRKPDNIETRNNKSKSHIGLSHKLKNKTCEYCGFETTPGNYGRWHGEKCKNKKGIIL